MHGEVMDRPKLGTDSAYLRGLLLLLIVSF